MRVGTAIAAGRRVPVIEHEDGWVPLDGPSGSTLLELIAAGEPLRARPGAAPLAGAELTAPLIPGKIIAIGLNYMDHIRESGMAQPDRPLIFTKFSSSVVGPVDTIEFDPELTQRVDWEVELAAVVGRRMRNVSVEEALDGVFGYTVANDVSARDLQLGDGQWVRGKSLDTFCPLGPSILTADEIGDPQALALSTRVNGETVQDSSTSEMIFGVAELLAFSSASFTLEPGDVVLTGTPWGCGEWTVPQRSLHEGDVVEAEVERLGVLRNPVAEIAGDRV